MEQATQKPNGDVQAELLEFIAEFVHDPLGFALAAYPWNEGSLEESDGPYDWQAEVFKYIGEHLTNTATRHSPCRIAVASGNGIGKSAFLSMLTGWAMSTFEDTKVTITAGTGPQLTTKTQPEMAKWFRLMINSHWFNVLTKSISIKDEKHAKEWLASFMTWDENNPDAFLGLHNKMKRILVIFDESSAIADVIWDTIQRALTDKDTEIIFCAFGNPNHNTGRFSECFGSDKSRWKTFQIDSRQVPGTNKKEIEEWAAKYGEDSDYFRYSVRGEFPRGGSAQFIPSDIVTAARAYHASGFERLPKILTCDVARFGDDETIIAKRQGRKFDVLANFRGFDTVQTAERLIEFINAEAPDATVIDGDGIGGAVVDHLKHRGYGAAKGIYEFHGGAAARDSQMYYNKRAECWGEMRDWLKMGAQIPNEADLQRQLTGPTYFLAKGKVNNGSICLESKEDMKKRGQASPDKGDALAYTFAVKVLPKPLPRRHVNQPTSWS